MLKKTYISPRTRVAALENKCDMLITSPDPMIVDADVEIEEGWTREERGTWDAAW